MEGDCYQGDTAQRLLATDLKPIRLLAHLNARESRGLHLLEFKECQEIGVGEMGQWVTLMHKC